MVAAEVSGMMLMALAGIASSVGVTLSTLSRQLNFPYYPLMGTASLLIGFICAVAITYRGDASKLGLHEWKWVWLRGVFGCATFILNLMAVAAGAPLGDVSALTSVNIVVAALMGRAFLGEQLRFLHIVALNCSILGAVLISKPDLFVNSQQTDIATPWLGYSLAVGAGMASGGLFIAARKSQGISAIVMTCSVATHEGIALFLLPWTGLVVDAPVEALWEAPLECAVFFIMLFMLTAFACVAVSVGAQLCPAAASSTIYTSTSMSFGYMAQVLIHHKAPQPITMMGACMMLLAVSLMALARWWYSKVAHAFMYVPEAHDSPTISSASRGEDYKAPTSIDVDTNSFMSFMATEFSGVKREDQTLRQRLLSAVPIAEPTLA